MRTVRILARMPHTDAVHVFDVLADFERYVGLVDRVKSVEMVSSGPEGAASRWEVYFRKGLLRWTERNHFDRKNLSTSFEQDEGDFDVFHGGWEIAQVDAAAEIDFVTTFDFGVPSIESIIEPIAERVIRENFKRTVVCLFGDGAEFVDVAPNDAGLESDPQAHRGTTFEEIRP